MKEPRDTGELFGSRGVEWWQDDPVRSSLYEAQLRSRDIWSFGGDDPDAPDEEEPK